VNILDLREPSISHRANTFTSCCMQPNMSHNGDHGHSSHGDHSHVHDHDHDHGQGHDGHDHTDETEPALQSLIWKQIDFDNIRTLNESEPSAGVMVVKKTWQQRLEADPHLSSDSDEQMLMFVP